MLFYKDLVANATIYSSSAVAPLPALFEQVPVLGHALNTLLPTPIHDMLNRIQIPKLWAFLALNVLTQ